MSTAENQPNIIFILSDQQRWDTCGCYGQKLPVTPNLDRMAAQGVRFENAFSCQPVCGPARACLQTGKYPSEVNCPTNNCLLPLDENTLPKWLSKAGYEVGYIGKWHLASCGPTDGPDSFRARPVPPERRGGYKDYWLVSDCLEFTSHSYDGHMFDADMNRREFPGRYRADVLGDWTLEYLGSRDGKKPFFLYLSFIEPHHQNDHDRYEGPHGSKEQWRDYEVPGDLLDTEGDWRENYPDYLGCCNSIDENVGRVRAKLDELGIAENTVTIYTSDHGSHFNTRNYEYKRACHDACTHIPLVICGPAFTSGNVLDNLVSLIDLPPTVLTAGGVALPDTMHGRPLQPLASGSAEDWLDEVFLQISEDHDGRAIRTRKCKYEIWIPSKKGAYGTGKAAPCSKYREYHLYDLENDPHERNDLVHDPAYAEVRASLAARLKIRMAEAHEEEPEIAPAVRGYRKGNWV